MSHEDEKCCKNEENHNCEEKHENGECCRDKEGHSHGKNCDKEGHGQGRGRCCRRRKAQMRMRINNTLI
ncbi:MAG: hypothetical protein Q4Q22_02310 [Methanosphaera sp.]|nr:hypothetical protein [Methanosphaera sp.]